MSPHVLLLDPSEPSTLQLCSQVFGDALDPEVHDDRLAGGVGEICAVAFNDLDTPVGYCMGTPNSDHLLALDLVLVEGFEPLANDLWTAAISAAPDCAPELWGRPAQPVHTELAADLGLHPSRVLYQMRAPLPVEANPVATVAFTPGVDDESWLVVNNASFAGHPDQGLWSMDDLQGRMAEPWFNPEGFRLFFDGEILAGFCWTKIHNRDGLETLGEIYVIGLAPSHHGLGLGVGMTAAGLEWLHRQGIKIGMLYVEADNTAAVATYSRLGFEVFATYRAWSTPGVDEDAGS